MDEIGDEGNIDEYRKELRLSYLSLVVVGWFVVLLVAMMDFDVVGFVDALSEDVVAFDGVRWCYW